MPGRGGLRSLVIGLDGSATSRRAAAMAARLVPPRGGRALVVRVVEPVRAPSLALLPAAIRARIAGEVASLEATHRRAAQRDVDAGARLLRRAGWRARGEVRRGVPLHELLRAARAARADVLVVGARGVSGVTRLLLGSVAEGAVKRAPISVLVVR
jgi:nucleotide-binding universal stress UspA family protein